MLDPRMIRALVVALVVACAGGASAEICHFASGASSWTGTLTVTGAGWTGCTASTDDSWEIETGAVVTVTGNLVGIVGSITVESGGVLDISPLVSVEARAGIVYLAGSCPGDSCQFGIRLPSTTAPASIVHSGSTIVLDFTENKSANLAGLPWNICETGCTQNDVRVGTLIWVNWQEFAAVDQGIREPVDAMGLFLEVTAVSNANDTVTLSLPRVDANAQANSYTVAESIAGGRQSNLISGTSWTVASVGIAENNEGKLRYETTLNSADSPFNLDGEFSGFLACRAGTARCARIIYTEADYSTTSELFTTLRDPSQLWAAGDELDVYYARIFPGNKLTPINPATITKTGDGTAPAMMVQDGAGILTVENLFFDNAWTSHVPGNGTGVLWFRNTTSSAQKRIRQIAFRGCDGPDIVAGSPTSATAASCLTIENTDTVSPGSDIPDGDTVQNLEIADLWFGYPNVSIDYATNPTVDGFQAFAIWFLEESAQRISNEATWLGTGGRRVANWKNVTMRRIRVEGGATGITNAPAGRMIDCDGGLYAQDVLAIHGRNSKPRDGLHGGEDQFELFPNTETCGIDRITVMRQDVGTGIGPFRWARPDGGIGWGGTVYATNLVELGGPAQQGNTNDAAGREIVNDTWPTPAPGVSPEGHTHGYPDAIGNGYYLSNFLTDGLLPAISHSFGAFPGWWTQRRSGWNIRQCGQRVIGVHRIGGSPSPAEGLNGLTACAGPQTDVVFSENFFVNMGGPTNNGSLATCDTNGANPGTSRYQCDGVANSNAGAFFTFASNLLPMPSLVFDRNLIHYGDQETAFKNFAWFAASTRPVPRLTMTNTTILANYPNVVRVFYDNTPGAGLVGVQAVTIGPNVWAMAGSTERCDSDDDTPTDALICSFPGPIGDLSPDLSPHGGTSIKLAGDVTTGRRLRVLGVGTADGSNDPIDAQPRHAGPLVWDVFSWVTPERSDLVVFERTTPALEYAPPIVRGRFKPSSGGSGSRFGVDGRFGVK